MAISIVSSVAEVETTKLDHRLGTIDDAPNSTSR